MYRYDYFKAILPSRKYLNDRSVDGRRDRESAEGARIDWNAAKAKLLMGEGGWRRRKVSSRPVLSSAIDSGGGGGMERDAWKTRLVRKLQSQVVKLL